jgi:hypothetical protein
MDISLGACGNGIHDLLSEWKESTLDNDGNKYKKKS